MFHLDLIYYISYIFLKGGVPPEAGTKSLLEWGEVDQTIFSKTRNEAVYDCLRSHILNRELKPGQRIIICNISRELNVRAIPVREAMKRLGSQGLINFVPHVGASVRRQKIASWKNVSDQIEK